jgi:hypothetical protein
MTMETIATFLIVFQYVIAFRRRKQRFSNLCLLTLGKAAGRKKSSPWRILSHFDGIVMFLNTILLTTVLVVVRFYHEYHLARERNDALIQTLIVLTLPYSVFQACGVGSSILGVTTPFSLTATYIKKMSSGELEEVLIEGIGFYEAVKKVTHVFKRVFGLNTIYCTWQAIVCMVALAEGWMTKRPVPLWLLLNGLDGIVTWLFTLYYAVSIVKHYHKLWDKVASSVTALSARRYDDARNGRADYSEIELTNMNAKEQYARDFLLLPKDLITIFGFSVSPSSLGSLALRSGFGFYAFGALTLSITITFRYSNDPH